MLSLIEGTLDIARIESGRLQLDVRPMAFADTVREVASMFELQAAGKGLRFVFEPGVRLPETVRADEKRLRQILINLLGNAVKFTREGEVRLRVSHAREMAGVRGLRHRPRHGGAGARTRVRTLRARPPVGGRRARRAPAFRARVWA